MRKNPNLKKWDDVDMFLVRNWWVMQVPGLENEPGLRAWSSRASIKLLELLGIHRAPATGMESRVKWYNKRRHRLTLSPYWRSYILDISRETDGKWTVKRGQDYSIIFPGGGCVDHIRDSYWHEAGAWYWRDAGPDAPK